MTRPCISLRLKDCDYTVRNILCWPTCFCVFYRDFHHFVWSLKSYFSFLSGLDFRDNLFWVRYNSAPCGIGSRIQSKVKSVVSKTKVDAKSHFVQLAQGIHLPSLVDENPSKNALAGCLVAEYNLITFVRMRQSWCKVSCLKFSLADYLGSF